jgi:hypothetical protein
MKQTIRVNCYSGQTYAERPESFIWEGTEYKVAKLEKEWLEPGEKHFLVRTEDKKLFELCYYEQSDEWSGVELVGG